MDKQGKKEFRKMALGWIQIPDAKKILRDLLALPKPTETIEGGEQSPGHALLYYFIRTLGAASLVLGAAGLMTDISFTICASCIYLGLVVLCIDPWIDPPLKKISPWLRVIPTVVFLVPLLAFTRYIVLLPAPLDVKATDYNGDFPPGRTVGGKEMRAAYSTLHVLFSNPTDHDFKDLDFVVAADQYVIAAESDGHLPVEVFNTVAGQDEITFSDKDKNGHVSYVDKSKTQLLSGGIRILCDRLPKNTSFDITIAIANVPSAGARAVPPSSDDLLTFSADDLDRIFGQRTPAKKVGISGWYKSLGQRPHRLRRMYDVKQL